MTSPYKVVAYSIDELLSLLAAHSEANKTRVLEKPHKIYLQGYFDGIKAKTIIVEYSYVDRDYLEDFVSYYIKCFRKYNRYCTRLHFFDISFSENDFRDSLRGEKPSLLKSLPEAYLGFIVVKPLPKTIIGRTCLKTFPEENGRCFPAVHKYEVNLFGLSLNIKTLAYQEQDQVAAACATSALWSIFHRTGALYHHPIPTPIDITKAATFNLPNQKRNLPNAGLTLEQMAHAIRNVGLEPFPVNAKNFNILKCSTYSYLTAGIPLALAILIIDTKQPEDNNIIGVHAIAVTGFCIGKEPSTPLGSSGFLNKATRINKLYVHDDQIGPFARMEFDNVTVTYHEGKNVQKDANSLSTSWKNKDGDYCRAVPYVMLLPLYHKIRIPLECIENILIAFDSILESFRENKFIPSLSKRVEWDIRLSTLNDFKKELSLSRDLQGEYREEILTRHMPRFIWRAIALHNNNPAFELIFDATDIEQGDFFMQAINYDTSLLNILIALAPTMKAHAEKYPCKSIFEWFEKQSAKKI